MPPETNSGKPAQTAQEYTANRLQVRFFCDVKANLNAIEQLVEAQCLQGALGGVELLQKRIETRIEELRAARIFQFELEGLLTAPDRAAVNQAEFGLSR